MEIRDVPRWHWIPAAITCGILLSSVPTTAADFLSQLSPKELALLRQSDDELTKLEASCIAPGKVQQQAAAEYAAAAPTVGDTVSAKSLALLRHAADLGNVDAQYLLGAVLQKNGFPIAERYLEKAAAQNDARAQQALGKAYYVGTDRPKDFSLAFKYYSACAARNFGDCATQVGKLYETGLGVQKNIPMALKYYSANASAFPVGANTRMAYIYTGAYPDVPKDLAKSLKLLFTALTATMDHPNSTGDEYATTLLIWVIQQLSQNEPGIMSKLSELKKAQADQHQYYLQHPVEEDNSLLPVP